MVASRKSSEETPRRGRPATTPQAREDQLIAMAYDEAEKQIRSGKATSQLLTHFLKQATRREELEQMKLKATIELEEAKSAMMKSQANQEELYKDAIRAFASYSGHEEDETEDDY